VLVQFSWLWLAGTASAETSAPLRSVDVIAAGDRATSLALQARLLPWLDARDVRLSWAFRSSIEPRKVLAQETSGEAVLARIWLDVRSTDRAILYVVDTRGERFLVRVLPVSGDYDEVTRESLGNILESAIDVLLLGGEIGLTRESATAQVQRELGSLEDPAPAPTPVAAATSSPAPAPADRAAEREAPLPEPADSDVLVITGVSIGAGVDTLSGNDAWRIAPQASVYFFGASAASLAGFGWFSAGYHLPSTWSAAEAGVDLHGPALHLLGGVRGRVARSVWRAALGVGAELTHVEPKSFDDEASPVAAFWIGAPLVSARVAFEPYLAERWFLSLVLGADLDLAGHHFDIAEGGTRTPLLEPWRVRPLALMAVGFDLGH